MTKKFIGNKSNFAIEYEFIDDTRETELSMFIDCKNILEFRQNEKILTPRWNFEELMLWLRGFIDGMSEEPYPVEVDGEFAAVKDVNAREFDTDDIEEFDKYYDKLDEWNMKHRWHTAASGAILPDLYFEQKGNTVEISWNNNDLYDGVIFSNILGGARIEKQLFVDVVDKFLKDYAKHWFA